MKYFLFHMLFGCLMLGGMVQAAENPSLGHPMWCPNVKADEADYHVAFRGSFELSMDAEVDARFIGCSWFVLWMDGAYLSEGPARFPLDHPEYQTVRVKLGAGKHVLAAQVHHEGVFTRMMENLPPFFQCAVGNGGEAVPVQWKCSRIGGYAQKLRRVNDQFGWVEWCDTRQVPADWKNVAYDDAPWAGPVPQDIALGELKPLGTAPVRQLPRTLTATDEGPLAEVYGYEKDNPSARFFLRNLACDKLPPQGEWRRYDLGRVRLGRPRFTLDLPAGAVIEFAYAESLSHGRVSPWITLSASDSCNLDHFVARGGVQEFFPLVPKGGRFMEVHVLAPPDQIRFLHEDYVERCYYDTPEGAFSSGDPLLDRIWLTGVETHRACAEDSLIDNPTRERGQWAGDVVAVGMDIAAAGYTDLRLCRRGLVQCAQCARKDGLISGLCPGGGAYLTTYAAQWVSACLHYWELTGDRALLEELFPFAERNFDAFRNALGKDGLKEELGWGFVDWGYVPNEGKSDMGVNLHYYAALRDMIRWCTALDKKDRTDEYIRQTREMKALLDAWFTTQRENGQLLWDKVGYHRAVLGLRLGFFAGEEEKGCVAFIKRHMLNCFPNDPDAPRLSDPQAAQPRLITPYFAHYAMPELIKRGEADFVLDQYRKCWGWMLEEDRTTWIEVFDTRWSHCHQWAGCPTWQLTRYILGLTPRFDLGANCFEWTLHPGSLTQASGKVPIPGTDGGATMDVEWHDHPDGIRSFTLDSPIPVMLLVEGTGETRRIEVSGKRTLEFVKSGSGWEVRSQ